MLIPLTSLSSATVRLRSGAIGAVALCFVALGCGPTVVVARTGSTFPSTAPAEVRVRVAGEGATGLLVATLRVQGPFGAGDIDVLVDTLRAEAADLGATTIVITLVEPWVITQEVGRDVPCHNLLEQIFHRTYHSAQFGEPTICYESDGDADQGYGWTVHADAIYQGGNAGLETR